MESGTKIKATVIPTPPKETYTRIRPPGWLVGVRFLVWGVITLIGFSLVGIDSPDDLITFITGAACSVMILGGLAELGFLTLHREKDPEPRDSNNHEPFEHQVYRAYRPR